MSGDFIDALAADLGLPRWCLEPSEEDVRKFFKALGAEEKEKAMPKKREQISLEPLEYRFRKDTVVKRVVLLGAFFQCTKCGGIKPGLDFGLRVEQGILRNQAQCKDCR